VILIATSKECGDVGVLHIDTSNSNLEAAAVGGSECGKNSYLLRPNYSWLNFKLTQGKSKGWRLLTMTWTCIYGGMCVKFHQSYSSYQMVSGFMIENKNNTLTLFMPYRMVRCTQQPTQTDPQSSQHACSWAWKIVQYAWALAHGSLQSQYRSFRHH
jgi:hypothetical protein